MTKAILIAVSDGFDGYGDFLFALKLSAQLKTHYAMHQKKVPSIYIVTQASGKQKIIALQGDIEFNAEIITPSELKIMVESNHIEVGILIEGPVFQSELIDAIDNALATVIDPIPLTMLPEYGLQNASHYTAILELQQEYRRKMLKHISYTNMILSGFHSNEHGILLSSELLNPDVSNQWVNQLDSKIFEPLLGSNQQAQTIEDYQAETDLYFQYSHDIYDNRYETLTGRKPVEHFLRLHREFVSPLNKNQDILMIGKNKKAKFAACKALQTHLILDGFQRITFYNADTKKNYVLHDTGLKGKAYRVIYTSLMSHRSMIACTALSGPITGATGDQSFSEAVSCGKIIIYECLNHKENLIKLYDEALLLESGNDLFIEASLSDIHKVSGDLDYVDLAEKLRNLQPKLLQFNRAVLKKYNYIEEVVDGIERGIDLNHQLHIHDDTILRTKLGFYKLSSEIIGKGGWSQVHPAWYFSVNGAGLQTFTDIAVKIIGNHQADLLIKEKSMLQIAYPNEVFEQMTINSHAFLAMPLRPGLRLDKYLRRQPNLKNRVSMAIGLLKEIKKIHSNSISHNDIKPMNIVYDAIKNKIHLVDFGCAEIFGTPMTFNEISNAKFAIEYMPPEYMRTDNHATPEHDVYSMTLTLAQILGINSTELVRVRMEKALQNIDNKLAHFIREGYLSHKSLDKTLFSPAVFQYRNTRAYREFIQKYVTYQYSFAPYEGLIGYQFMALLYDMQAQNPNDRPTIDECIRRLMYPHRAAAYSTKAMLRLLQLGDYKILAVEKEKRPWMYQDHEYLTRLLQQVTHKGSQAELRRLIASCPEKSLDTSSITLKNPSFFYQKISKELVLEAKLLSFSLSRGQVEEMSILKVALERKINSFWFYRNKPLKKLELTALGVLENLAKRMPLDDAIKEIKNQFPHLKTDAASKLTTRFLTRLESDSTFPLLMK